MKQKLVLIGNGMAGMKVVEELLEKAPDLYDICVFGAEPHGNYNRILLSPVLSGEKSWEEIIIQDHDWYDRNQIKLHAGKMVVDVDRSNRVVRAADGTEEAYDRLIVATGSSPFIIPVPGKDLDGVIAFRTIEDVHHMLSASQNHRHAVVIGGGLLGLEAANGLLKQGMDVVVVHNVDILMNRQLDPTAALLLQKALESRQLSFKLSAQTEELIADEQGRVKAVRFADGSIIPADLVVMAVGIRPNMDLGKKIGLACGRGIQVDDRMLTSDSHIFSVGECIEHRGETFGLVAPLFEQARVIANQLIGDAASEYIGTITSTKLKVTGIDVFSAGQILEDDSNEVILFQDPARGVYRKLVLKDNKIVGAVAYGDTTDASWYFQLLKDGSDISDVRDYLIFGQSFANGGAAEDPAAKVLAMPDSAEICGCNGVCKGKIVSAIKDFGLTTLDEVKAKTKASASCGSCAPLVEQVLAATLGDSYDASSKKQSICGCTELSHDEVRLAIRERHLTSIPQVFSELGWHNSDGCHLCRPAVNYYLTSIWPEEAVDEGQSRFTNERVHANIQKDNTYTVVPRMWGGLTNSHELRALADAADKYQVPMVKVTGGQRIDLVGVKKEQLPLIWKDLNDAGFVSGHAYGKALRTVKTCIGKEYCRFGTQNSTQMGVDLEKLSWGSWTPAKVKMAVSGCPRNCAEATIKDFGVIAVDSGWELHVGGNGGIKVRVCDLLTKVETAEEVLEYAGAFMQLYREEARYGERTAHWIERVGVDYIKQRLVDDEAGRKDWYQRFMVAQKVQQKDPWQELAAQPELFQPLQTA